VTTGADNAATTVDGGVGVVGGVGVGVGARVGILAPTGGAILSLTRPPAADADRPPDVAQNSAARARPTTTTQGKPTFSAAAAGILDDVHAQDQTTISNVALPAVASTA
jgi:hypothetical protein